jgi:hypothetical protein
LAKSGGHLLSHGLWQLRKALKHLIGEIHRFADVNGLLYYEIVAFFFGEFDDNFSHKTLELSYFFIAPQVVVLTGFLLRSFKSSFQII